MLDPGDVVGGRWRIERDPVRGGQADVYAARDIRSGEAVAIKVLWGIGAEEVRRAERELLALELLKVPGVVRLLGSGLLGRDRYLVLAWVEGRPFPGTPDRLDWERLQVPLRSLLSVLADVHANEVIHRDIKPDNVLVGPDGGVTLVDFGLARGRALGEPVTGARDVWGTPRYVPPEVLAGEEPGVRADLFAVGVMVGDALDTPVDALPVEARTWLASLTAEAAGRPESALAALEGLIAPERRRLLPFIGRVAALDGVIARVTEGRPVRIAGVGGSGRTRLMKEVERRLRDGGRPVCWVPPGERTFASLLAMGLAPTAPDAELDEVERAMRAQLQQRLQAEVLLMDDAHRVDPRSSSLLATCAGPVVRTVEVGAEADIVLDPLKPEDLEELFVGPERLVHLRSGPARELFRRTGGHARTVAAELAGWEAARLATREEGRYRVTVDSLDRLRAGARVIRLAAGIRALGADEGDVLAAVAFTEPYGTRPILAALTGRPGWEIQSILAALAGRGLILWGPEGTVRDLSSGATLPSWTSKQCRDAHALVVERLPSAAPERVVHALRGGRPDAESITVGVIDRIAEAGDLSRACALACSAHAWLSREGDVPELSRAWALLAIESQELRTLHELSGVHLDARLATLLEGATRALSGDGLGALSLLTEMGEQTDSVIECWRHILRAQAASRLDSSVFLSIAQGVAASVSALGDGDAQGRALGLLGRARYLSGELEGALHLHRRAAALRSRVGGQLASSTAVVATLLELGRWDEAWCEGERSLSVARACGHRVHEARSEWLLRRVAYQSGSAAIPDTALIASAGFLGVSYLEGLILLNEAAVAWRAGALSAVSLANRSAALLRQSGLESALLAEALSRQLVGRYEPLRAASPGVAVQTLALTGAPASEVRAEAERIPCADWGRRRELVSVEECLSGAFAAR